MIGNILIYTFFFTLSLGQLSRLSFLNSQFNIYAPDVVLVFTLLYLFLRYKLRPITSSTKGFRFTFLLLIFLAVTFLVGIVHFSVQENIVSFSYFLRLLLYWLVFFYAIFWRKKDKHSINHFKKGCYVFAASVLITSVIQYFLYPDLRNIEYLGWDPHLHRMVGTFLDTAVAASVYGILAIFFLGRKQFILFAVFLLGVLLTYSRSAYIGIIIFTVIFIVRQKLVHTWLQKPAHLFLTLAVTMAVFTSIIFLLPKPFGEGGNLLRTITVASRLTDYEEAITLWQKDPLIGVGFNRLRYAKEQAHFVGQEKIEVSHSGASLHSSYLILLVTGGIIGLILYILFLKEVFLRSALGCYLFIYVGIISLADNILLHAFILPLVLFLLVADQLSFS